jgi:hypothetical protein
MRNSKNNIKKLKTATKIVHLMIFKLNPQNRKS